MRRAGRGAGGRRGIGPQCVDADRARTEALAAIRYAKERVRVNSMHPGFIDTPMVEQIKGTPVEQMIIQNTPVGRLGRPEEIGDVIAFLCGPKASYMTGSEIYVDGGWTAA